MKIREIGTVTFLRHCLHTEPVYWIYTFLVKHGCSAMLPIDVMFGRMQISLEGGKGLPECVEQVGQSLR